MREKRSQRLCPRCCHFVAVAGEKKKNMSIVGFFLHSPSPRDKRPFSRAHYPIVVINH